MPHLVIKNIEKKEFISKVKDFSAKLTEVIGCPEDWITISHIENNVTFVAGEDMTKENIFVEVNWFDRPQEIKDKVAILIDETFKNEGSDIMIVFKILTKENYYENGKNC